MKEWRHTHLQESDLPAWKAGIFLFHYSALWLPGPPLGLGYGFPRSSRSISLQVSKSVASFSFTGACWPPQQCSLLHISSTSWNLRDGRDPESLRTIASPVGAHLLSASVLPWLEVLVAIRSLKNVALCCHFVICTHCSMPAVNLLPLLEALLIKSKKIFSKEACWTKGNNLGGLYSYIYKYIIKY